MVVPFVGITGVEKAAGRYGRKLRILNSAIVLGYNLMEARHMLYVSYQLLLFSCPTNITICMIMWPHMPEDQGLNISCTELLWLLVFNSLLARSACCLRLDL
jgi:hypothetical protein